MSSSSDPVTISEKVQVPTYGVWGISVFAMVLSLCVLLLALSDGDEVSQKEAEKKIEVLETEIALEKHKRTKLDEREDLKFSLEQLQTQLEIKLEVHKLQNAESLNTLNHELEKLGIENQKLKKQLDNFRTNVQLEVAKEINKLNGEKKDDEEKSETET